MKGGNTRSECLLCAVHVPIYIISYPAVPQPLFQLLISLLYAIVKDNIKGTADKIRRADYGGKEKYWVVLQLPRNKRSLDNGNEENLKKNNKPAWQLKKGLS